MPDSRDSFQEFRTRSAGALGRLHGGLSTKMAAAFAVEMSDEDFLIRMRKRCDEMRRELKAPPSWRWFKKHVLRTGDEVNVTSQELARLLRMAEMEVPENGDAPRFLRVPLRAFADLLARAEARYHETLDAAAEREVR